MAHLRRLLHPVLMATAVAAAISTHAAAAAPVVHKVGAVTRHASTFIGQDLVLSGYFLAREDGYILFSDEAGGRISRYDLPVTGVGIDQIAPRTRYLIEGKFLDQGLTASNGNPDHLELAKPPQVAGP